MYWAIFHTIKYLDIAAFLLVAGYACYEYFYAWVHDQKVEVQLAEKVFNFELSEDSQKELQKLSFGDIIYSLIALFVAVIILAFIWPIALPVAILWGAAWYIRERVRKEKENVS